MGLGELEQMILFALVRLDGREAHGAVIIDEIEERVGRRVTPGALYTVLSRLEEKGMVEAWIGESTPARGGRRRKLYRLRPEGAAALRAWYEGVREMADGMAGRLEALARGAS